MASIITRKGSKARTIAVQDAAGERRYIGIGTVPMKDAQAIRRHVEELQLARLSRRSPGPHTSAWLEEIPDVLHAKLERIGLAVPRERARQWTVADWCQHYIEGRTDVKPGTRTNLEQTAGKLAEFCGAKRLDEVTAGDADDFRIHLKATLAEATVRRHCKRARQFFHAAARKKLVRDNPFRDLACGHYANPERFHYVTSQEAEAVLEACPDAEWRLIFALCRYGGLRCPSEVLRLTWADVDWQRDRLTVHASKTEAEADGGIRQVPIFPELLPHLRDCFDLAQPGDVYVIRRYRDISANLRTRFKRILEKAKLKPWPKLFQNCRSTRETELAEDFPIQAVCEWIGNSEAVARRHYLQVTDEHWARAIGCAAPGASAGSELSRTPSQKQGVGALCEPLQRPATYPLTPRGLEPRLPG